MEKFRRQDETRKTGAGGVVGSEQGRGRGRGRGKGGVQGWRLRVLKMTARPTSATAITSSQGVVAPVAAQRGGGSGKGRREKERERDRHGETKEEKKERGRGYVLPTIPAASRLYRE